jgi:hypothetical protein
VETRDRRLKYARNNPMRSPFNPRKRKQKLYAALFHRLVKVGEQNPPGEVTGKGYSRVMVKFVDGKPRDNIVFPKCQEDWRPVKCLAILDREQRVLGVQELPLANDTCEDGSMRECKHTG